jgi:crotonobetainyl-CoA:carnitine CoA-transferase CaiB-like acyl-CoA transferase
MSNGTHLDAPFCGLRVIELAFDPAGEFAGRLLAGMGADVVKVEPPQGSPTRGVGPFVSGKTGPDNSLNFWFYNANKKSVIADIRTKRGRERIERLIGEADVLISTLGPAELHQLDFDLNRLIDKRPELIVLSVTPFGLTGPWAAYKSSDLVALALGGPLNTCGYDDHSIPPIRPGGNQGYHSATSYALLGVLLALIDRQHSGKGQLIDVSMHETLAVNVELANPFWFYPRVNVHRQTCRHAQPTPTQPALFQCADGRYVYYVLILTDTGSWKSLVRWLDEKDMAANLTDPEFEDISYRQQHFADIQTIIECFFLVQTAEEAYHAGQAHGLPIGILNAPEDLLKDEHLQARGFFVDVEQADGSTVKFPGAPYHFSSFSGVPLRRAPLLGEHDGEEG